MKKKKAVKFYKQRNVTVSMQSIEQLLNRKLNEKLKPINAELTKLASNISSVKFITSGMVTKTELTEHIHEGVETVISSIDSMVINFADNSRVDKLEHLAGAISKKLGIQEIP